MGYKSDGIAVPLIHHVLENNTTNMNNNNNNNHIIYTTFLIIAALSCTVMGQYRPTPISPGQVIRIISQTQDGPNPDGSYSWSYESENGISAREEGRPKGQDLLEAQGDFKYTAPDGTPIAIQYVANENGFQPQGAHLPTPPPIPAAILRSLEYNAAHPEEDQDNRGFRRP